MRTTVDIDDLILKEVRSLGREEGKSLGRVISDLLADGLRAHRDSRKEPQVLHWIARPMAARLDVMDKDAVYSALESEPLTRKTDRP